MKQRGKKPTFTKAPIWVWCSNVTVIRYMYSQLLMIYLKQIWSHFEQKLMLKYTVM